MRGIFNLKIVIQTPTKHYNVKDTSYLISIPLEFKYKEVKASQPNHFGAEQASKSPMQSGTFLGDISQGGSCNVFNITLNPHCNGTHTESSWHVNDFQIAPYEILRSKLFFTRLVSLVPSPGLDGDTYPVDITDEDLVITKKCLQEVLGKEGFLEALVVRTFPNSQQKKMAKWGNESRSPFFSEQAIEYINSLGVKHIAVDFPSLDKEDDNGHLKAHKTFFTQKEKTVSELIYVDDAIKDGLYALSIDVPPLVLDAVPSTLRLFEIEEV